MKFSIDLGFLVCFRYWSYPALTIFAEDGVQVYHNCTLYHDPTRLRCISSD